MSPTPDEAVPRELFAEWARASLAMAVDVTSGHETLLPSVTVRCADGAVRCYMLCDFPAAEPDQRVDMLAGLGLTLAAQRVQVVAAFMYFDVWASTYPETDCPPFRPPCKDPDRRSMLAFFGRTIDRKSCIATLPREERDGYRTTLDESALRFDVEGTSRFQDAFWFNYCAGYLGA